MDEEQAERMIAILESMENSLAELVKPADTSEGAIEHLANTVSKTGEAIIRAIDRLADATESYKR